jgi:hypothetical protein
MNNLQPIGTAQDFHIPTKTTTYARKYLTHRSLVLFSWFARLRQIARARAAIDLSALQYGNLKY